MGNLGSGSPRSREDIEAAISAFTPANWARLKMVANRYAVARVDPMDLVQEAMLRALTGGRHCPADVDVVRFLAEAIRSVADDERQRVGRRELLPLSAPGEPVRGAVDPPDQAETAEQVLIRRQTVGDMLKALLTLFDDDATARDIIEGEAAGMTADEIKEITDLTGQDYDSKRRLIRRRINKNYPKGWDR